MPKVTPQVGYTLVELVAAVLIVSLLAAVAAPKVFGGSDETAVKATAQHLRTIALAAELFYNDRGDWPVDAGAGAIPAGLHNYLRPNLLSVTCPVGGVYDWDQNRFGVQAAIKIVAPKPATDVMLALDRLMDDGDLATGYVVDLDGFKLIVGR